MRRLSKAVEIPMCDYLEGIGDNTLNEVQAAMIPVTFKQAKLQLEEPCVATGNVVEHKQRLS